MSTVLGPYGNLRPSFLSVSLLCVGGIFIIHSGQANHTWVVESVLWPAVSPGIRSMNVPTTESQNGMIDELLCGDMQWTFVSDNQQQIN